MFSISFLRCFELTVEETPSRDGTLGKTRLSAIQQALRKPAVA
jgi:hypothetical protein